MQEKTLWGGITKVDSKQRIVGGYYTDEKVDMVGDRILKEATIAALPEWKEWGNIREQHGMPVGTAVKIGEPEWNYLEAKIVDDDAWKKVEGGVYKGFSVGIIVDDMGPIQSLDLPDELFQGDANEWRKKFPVVNELRKIQLIECSITDRPANPRAKFVMMKKADALLTKDTGTPTAGKDVTGGPEILATNNNTEVQEPDEKAFGSDFPDAAFAVVENTGEKDEAGRTTPKDARHLPHHTKDVTDGNANDTVDLPHYRNALARVNQIKPVTDASKDELIKKAEAHLEKHRAVLEESLEPTKEKQVDKEKTEVAAPETPLEPMVQPEVKSEEPIVEKEGEPGGGDGMQQMQDMMRQMMDMMSQVLDAVKDEPKPTDEELAQAPKEEKSAGPEVKKEEFVTEVKTETVEVAEAKSKGNLVKAIAEVMDKSFGDFLAKAEEKDAALKKEILDYIEKLRNQAQPTQAALITEEPKVEEKPQPVTPESVRKNLRTVIETRFENKQGK